VLQKLSFDKKETFRSVASWELGRGRGGAELHPLNFSLSENFLPKIQNVGLEIPVLGNLWEKLKF